MSIDTNEIQNAPRWTPREDMRLVEAAEFRPTHEEVNRLVKAAYLRGYNDGVAGNKADPVGNGIPVIDTAEGKPTCMSPPAKKGSRN
jgi:hypothetical protein